MAIDAGEIRWVLLRRNVQGRWVEIARHKSERDARIAEQEARDCGCDPAELQIRRIAVQQPQQGQE